MKKQKWLRDAVATPAGYVSKNGEMLKRIRLSPAYIVEWNGWEDRVPADCKVDAPVVKEVKIEESVGVTTKEVDMTKCDCEHCEDPDCDCDCHDGVVDKLAKLFGLD